jgi:hypothetical protein
MQIIFIVMARVALKTRCGMRWIPLFCGGSGTKRSVGTERSIPFSHSMYASFSVIRVGSCSASSSASFNISRYSLLFAGVSSSQNSHFLQRKMRFRFSSSDLLACFSRVRASPVIFSKVSRSTHSKNRRSVSNPRRPICEREVS